MENFGLSKKTLSIIENFTKFLSNEKAEHKKLRLTPEWIEFKISGIIGFFDASNEENVGFNEIVISDAKKFIDLVGKIGLNEAQYKAPFLYLKQGNAKVKYHTSPLASAKPIDRKIITIFDKLIENKELIIEPFELDFNEMNSFFANVNLMNYDSIKFESKNNGLKLIGFDSKGIDGGYYEESLEIKTKEKISVSISKDILSKMIKGNYKLYFSEDILKFQSIDIPELSYYTVPEMQ